MTHSSNSAPAYLQHGLVKFPAEYDESCYCHLLTDQPEPRTPANASAPWLWSCDALHCKERGPETKATDSPQHDDDDDEQAAQEIMALVDSTPNLTAAERDRCQTSLDALRKPKATPNPATTLTPARLTELEERYNQ